MLLSSLTLVLACGEKDGDDTSGETGDTDVADGVSPELFDGDAHCFLHDTGDQFYQWTFTVSYTDPQGVGDVPGGVGQHDLAFLQGDNIIHEMSGIVVCDPNQGNCFASFKEADYGIPCSSAEDWTVRFTLFDYEGNSGTLDVQAYED